MTPNDKQTETFANRELVEGLLSNDERIINYFFFNRCAPLFGYIIRNVFDYRVDKDELISELYLYLQENDWQRLRQFDYRCKLTTWLSTMAVRFFWKKKGKLIENRSKSALYIKEESHNPHTQLIRRMDIEVLLGMMSSTRYREVLQALFIEDIKPQELADEMGITVDYLYNLKRRALAQYVGLTNDDRLKPLCIKIVDLAKTTKKLNIKTINHDT